MSRNGPFQAIRRGSHESVVRVQRPTVKTFDFSIAQWARGWPKFKFSISSYRFHLFTCCLKLYCQIIASILAVTAHWFCHTGLPNIVYLYGVGKLGKLHMDCFQDRVS